MRNEPKVLLAYPPNQLMPIETPRPDWSLGLLYLHGALEQLGIDADIVDMSMGTDEDNLKDTFFNQVMQENDLIRIGMSPQRIRAFLEARQYDIVAINSNFTPQTRMALEVAKIAKSVNPQCLIIAGGVNARADGMWQRFMQTGNFDIICTTEGERVIMQIVMRWMLEEGYRGIPGTIFFDADGRCEKNPPAPDTFYRDLDMLPIPSWHKMPFAKLARIAKHGVDLTGTEDWHAHLQTSRGCPFQCSFCHVWAERFDRTELSGNIGELRVYSVARVLEHINIIREQGVKKIFFEDDSLFPDKERILKIFTAVADMGLTILDVNGVNLAHLFLRNDGSRKRQPDQAFLEMLTGAGFRQIVFPVESGSQRILNKYATKKLFHERMDVVELVRVAHKAGIACPINMMVGFPDETKEEMELSKELAKRLIGAGAPYVTFFIPIPFPGSGLYLHAIGHGHLAPDFNPDIMNWKNGVMEHTTMPREEIVAFRDQATLEVNPPEHNARREMESAGHRWQSGAPTAP